MQRTQHLFQILLVWVIRSLLTEASEPREFDLNKTWSGDETDLIDSSNKINRDKNDGSTSNTCAGDKGTSDASSHAKTRSPSDAFIPVENPAPNLEPLSRMEKNMSSHGEAADHQETDLKKISVENDTEEINEIKNDGSTSTTSYSDVGPRNRPSWKAYVPAEISESKLNTLIKMETHILSLGVSHYWDYSNFKVDRVASLILCKQIWSTLKAKGINLDDKSEARPVCSKATMRNLNVRNGGYCNTGHYHYISSTEVYYLNTLRCECGYKVLGLRKSVDRTNTFFLVHKILPKQYLILSPVNPDMPCQKERYNIHLVDYFEEP